MSFFVPPPFVRPEYVKEVLQDAPLRYLRLGELSGSSAGNLGSDGVSHTYNNMEALGAQALLRTRDASAQFNGSSSYVTGSTLGVSLPFTVEFWAKADTLSDNVAILQTHSDSVYRGMMVLTSSTGSIVIQTGSGSGASAAARRNFGSASGVMVVGTAYHIVVVVNAHTSVDLYVNGASVSAPAGSGTGASISLDAGTFYVGRRTDTGSFYFDGYIDEVAVYNSALSASRIAAHYQAGR